MPDQAFRYARRIISSFEIIGYKLPKMYHNNIDMTTKSWEANAKVTFENLTFTCPNDRKGADLSPAKGARGKELKALSLAE
ncbi:MAG: hypothetical protein NT178_18655 [Proteobacteria bacterium]|nr:hypothetical protein [Pseudomonadota bacterium]